jgi:hypothetical protein
MSAQAERFANEAIFVRQFNTREAIRYVCRNANVGENEATLAVRSVVTFHRK